MTNTISYIKTVKERCRVCYTCVRECPAKAIRIADGQAEVMPERCISCGNCVRVCSQNAKQVVSTIELVKQLLNSGHTIAAAIAPSFPAEFTDLHYQKLVAMIRKLGFTYVNEVAFGADLVANAYRKHLQNAQPDQSYIATSCPAVVGYIEKYYPKLVPNLLPVVSPMVATARVLHHLHGDDLKIVFIGPCVAKKCEADRELLPNEIDAVLTFAELRDMFQQQHLHDHDLTPAEFDQPHGNLGALFPISRGVLQAANIREDLLHGNVVATDGRTNFIEAVKEFDDGYLDAQLLEMLACNGCIMGAGMTANDALFARRRRVSAFAREHAQKNQENAALQFAQFANLDLAAHFASDDQRIPVPFPDEINYIMNKMGKFTPADELNCGACGYDTCREHAVAIFKGLAETEMCLPHTIDQLRSTVGQLASSNDQLASAQEALMQSEKLASMGQLAAGIAHEINNPLGVVLMYSHLLLEQPNVDPNFRDDLNMIAEQADRCKKIVAGLLHFARQNKIQTQKTQLPELIQRVLKVASIPNNINATFNNNLTDPNIDVDPDQIVQVLTNLVTNALAAMPDGGQLTISANGDLDRIALDIQDTGVGIPPENIPKLFEPFFTTKKPDLGTGLGLAVTYGIVKMHRGDIRVTSNADPDQGPSGTTFTLTLPRHAQKTKQQHDQHP